MKASFTVIALAFASEIGKPDKANTHFFKALKAISKKMRLDQN
jgi:hypothetical protein